MGQVGPVAENLNEHHVNRPAASMRLHEPKGFWMLYNFLRQHVKWLEGPTGRWLNWWGVRQLELLDGVVGVG